MKTPFIGLLGILALVLLVSVDAHADVSVSSDAGRNIENGQNDTIKRDKNMSVDKSQGNKSTVSDSRERAREKSKSRSKSNKTSRSTGTVKSSSIDININGLLLREFTARYERDGTGTGKAGQYFGLCKPLTRAIDDYPVVYWGSHGYMGDLAQHVGGLNDARAVGNHWVNSDHRFGFSGHLQGGGVTPNHIDQTFVWVSRYIQCRITASFWVAEAGERAAAFKVHSEAEVADRINQIFSEMDTDASVFQSLRQRARDLWAQEACSSWLVSLYDYQSPNIQCGVFSFDGKTYTVENRETLSESSINGRSYKIALVSSAGDSVVDDQTVSDDYKVSSTNKMGDSNEHYKEAKKTASLNKSKSIDENSSNKVDRSSGNSTNAAPKE